MSPFTLRSIDVLEEANYSRLTSDIGPGHDPFYPVSAASSAGFLVMCTGVRENLRLANPSSDPTSTEVPTAPLVMTAPSDILQYPLFGWDGGAIFGDDYAYRYRYKNSKTGEVSGLSPLPNELWNLGKRNSSTSEDWTGQDAYIELEGTDFPGVDTLQLFRNTTAQVAVFYLLEEVDNPGLGNIVEVHDAASDEDLFLRETDGLSVNPSYLEGRPWACAKVFAHPTGRVMLYGLHRHGEKVVNGTWRGGTNTILGVVPSPNPVHLGMRVSRVLTVDFTEYRIVDVGQDSYTVYPEIATEGDDTGDFVITDDRDGRTIFMSKPGKPWSYDMLEVLSVGHDQDDSILHIESMNGQTVVFTRKKVYALLDDFTEAPHLTYRVAVLANEGTLGLRSTAYTPFGMVFANDRGVRLLAGLVQPVGSASPVNDFLPAEQYSTIDVAMASETFVAYDFVTHLLHVSYVPANQTTYTEELVYDPETGVWRGPWRRHIYNIGEFTESGGEILTALGDDAGNLQLDQVQSLDIVPPSAVITASITKLRNFHTFDINVNPDPNGTNRIIGAPVLVETSTGVFSLGFLAGVEDLGGLNTLVLSEEITGLAVGQKVFIGYVNWELRTAYFDGGEPVRPKEFQKFRTRFERPEEAECDFLVQAARDGADFEEAEYSEVVKCVPETSYADLRISMRARVFQLGLSGVSDTTTPKITIAGADISVRRGD